MTTPHDALQCEEALDLLEPFLDGDLDAGDADRLRGHLAACPACAAELAFAERVQRELRALPQPECPPELLARVVQNGRGEVVPFLQPQPQPQRTGRLRIAAAAALLILTIGGGSLFVHLQHVQQQREQVAEATREARLALAYFGKVTRKAGFDVRDEVLEKRLVIPVTRGVSRSLGNSLNPPSPLESRKEL
jgi:anti-sigma factor (TIGR02949 family)